MVAEISTRSLNPISIEKKLVYFLFREGSHCYRTDFFGGFRVFAVNIPFEVSQI